MKRFSFLISIITSIFPLAVLSLFFYNELKSITEVQILSNIERELEIGAKNLNDFLQERKGNLAEWSKSSTVKVAFEFSRPEGLSTYLEFLKNHYPAYEWIIVVDNKKKLFSTTRSFERSKDASKDLLENITFNNVNSIVINDDLYVLHKIKDQTKQLGFIIAKISKQKYLDFTDQIKEHLQRFKLKNLNVGHEVEVNNDNTIQLCSTTKPNVVPLCVTLIRSDLSSNFKTLQTLVISLTLFLILITFIITYRALKKLISPFYKILNSLTATSDNKFEKISLNSNLKELQNIESKFNSAIESLNSASINLRSQTRNQAIFETSLQVAHDIRSPLEGIKSLRTDLSSLPEETRRLLHISINRIEEIASDLLKTYKESKLQSDEYTSEEILNLVESILIEKKSEYRSHLNLELEADFTISSYGLFSIINKSKFKRIISNIINNAVEAFDNKTGRIKLSIYSSNEWNFIEISDNGSGIPDDLKNLIFTEGYTTKKNGNGMGLSFAQKEISYLSGCIDVQTKTNVGTTFTIRLPPSEMNQLFVKDINVYKYEHIFLIDDEPSSHELWKNKLKQVNSKITHFYSASDFINTTVSLPPKSLILTDCDLLSVEQDGIDVINTFNHSKDSILITSKDEELVIRERCKASSIRLLAKSMLKYVQIRTVPQNIILIDDDKIMHLSWSNFCKTKQLPFQSFYSINDFLAKKTEFPKDALIFIDSNFNNGISGELDSKRIKDAGFSNLFLATGYLASELKKPSWIKSIYSKNPETINIISSL